MDPNDGPDKPDAVIDKEVGAQEESPSTEQMGQAVEKRADGGPDTVSGSSTGDTVTSCTGESGIQDEGRKTLFISSSSKARTQIEVCLRCNSDNPPGAHSCESCGADLDKQREERSLAESRERLEKYTHLVEKPQAGGHGRTVLRSPPSSPAARPEADAVEKRSYHSQYFPPGASGENLDHEEFRSDVIPAPMRPIQQGRQLPHLPVDTAPQHSEEKQTSFVVGVAIAAVLFVVFSALVATMIVLLLK